MKLLYLLPGNVEIGLGFAEMERRRGILQTMAAAGTEMGIDYVRSGPPCIESMFDEYTAIPGAIQGVIQAEKDGYDGVIMGCAGDPGVDGARECVNIPVVGPAQASFAVAATLGRRFSIITPLDSMLGTSAELAHKCGYGSSLASVRSTRITVLDINRNPNVAVERTMEEARKAMELDGADSIVLGCMSLAFAQGDKLISKEIGIPVINPAFAAVKQLEMLVAMGLAQSKKAYPTPTRFCSL